MLGSGAASGASGSICVVTSVFEVEPSGRVTTFSRVQVFVSGSQVPSPSTVVVPFGPVWVVVRW